MGCIGHGPVYLLCQSAAELGWSWSLVEQGWLRPDLPLLRLLPGPWQHVRDSVMPGVSRLLVIVVIGPTFVGGLIDVEGNSLAPRTSVSVPRRCCEVSCLGMYGMASWDVREEKLLHVALEEEADGDGHLFWECPLPLLLSSEKALSLLGSGLWIVVVGHVVWSGTGGWLLFSGSDMDSPWAADVVEVAVIVWSLLAVLIPVLCRPKCSLK